MATEREMCQDLFEDELDDADRYRWLCHKIFRDTSGHLDLGGEILCNWTDPNKSEIDYAIDEAMKVHNDRRQQ